MASDMASGRGEGVQPYIMEILILIKARNQNDYDFLRESLFSTDMEHFIS